MGALPAGLSGALEALLAGRSRRDLAERSSRISEAYRNGRASDGPLRGDADALAYAIARMPATYAAMAYALARLAEALPDLRPESLLDAGCGPGTAAFAAVEAFPELTSLALIDRNGPFLALARQLLPAVGGGRTLTVDAGDLTASAALPAADLVTAGYVLAEIRDLDVVGRARLLWAAARQALVIAEPGTPEGFDRIRRIRDDLIGAGAHVAAPCTHQAACPMAGAAFCRVPVRVQRSRDHRAVKGGTLGHEDEPLAYLVLTREKPRREARIRIVAPPSSGKAAVVLTACGDGVLTEIRAAARDRENYKKYNKLRWGDEVPIQAAGASGIDSAS